MQHRDVLTRSSRDKLAVNKHGIKLLDLCKSAGILILNGRIGHDKGIGESTRDDTTGKSVVNYAIGTGPQEISWIGSPADFSVDDDNMHCIQFPKSTSCRMGTTCEIVLVTWGFEQFGRCNEWQDFKVIPAFLHRFCSWAVRCWHCCEKNDKYISQACERTFK